MPHFQWLGIARIGPPTWSVWIRVLLGVAIGALVVAIGLVLVR